MSDPQDWIGSPFTIADLHGKTVAFSFRGEDGHIYAGEGRLIAVARGDRMRVRIVREQGVFQGGAHVFVKAHIIFGSDSAKLVRNPSGSKCEFACNAL